MRSLYTTGSIIAALAVTYIAITACSAEDLKSELVEKKAISLFNGKDLTGWKKVGGTGSFKVEDGCIVGSGVRVVGNTFLRTEKTYTDFEFTYEFKFDHLTGNSGVMFRAEQKPAEDGNGQVFGYQCEADNKKSQVWTAGIYDEKRRGWLSPRKITKNGELTPEEVIAKTFATNFTTQGTKLFKWDDWNTITIRCVGNNIKTYLNGELRVDFTDINKKHDTREGFFGLQIHQGKACQVRWRNITLKDLSSTKDSK